MATHFEYTRTRTVWTVIVVLASNLKLNVYFNASCDTKLILSIIIILPLCFLCRYMNSTP